MLAGYPPFYDDKPMGIYQRILDGYYEIPQNIDKRSRDLIKRLLVAEKSSRLACGRVRDLAQIEWANWLESTCVVPRSGLEDSVPQRNPTSMGASAEELIWHSIFRTIPRFPRTSEAPSDWRIEALYWLLIILSLRLRKHHNFSLISMKLDSRGGGAMNTFWNLPFLS